MKQRTITTNQERDNAINAIMALPLPLVIGVGKERLLSNAANARYWTTLSEHRHQLNDAIERDYSTRRKHRD